MKKKILVVIVIVFAITGIIFINQNKEEKTNENISIILSNSNGNTTTDKFPDKDSYTFEKIECDNELGEVTPTFNEETWKLDISITGEKIESNFKCQIYFKEKEPTAAETIIAKYSEDNTEGLIKVDQPATDQMKATTEYRYSGSDVNNYVNFNNETWRIIGVFDVDDGTGNYEQRIKIIREESIGSYSWDSSASGTNDGLGINQWGESEDSSGNAYSGADLKTLLNTTYYNKAISGTCYNGSKNASISCDFSNIGLSETARSMIDDAKWYTAGVNFGTTTSTAYTEERSNALPPTGAESLYNDTIKRTKNWTGKLALPYPSDYGYASSSCYNTDESLLYYDFCVESSWLYTGSYYWFLSPNVFGSYSAFLVDEDDFGVVGQAGAFAAYGVRPVVYLSPEVRITGGTGENAENAYQLSL